MSQARIPEPRPENVVYVDSEKAEEYLCPALVVRSAGVTESHPQQRHTWRCLVLAEDNNLLAEDNAAHLLWYCCRCRYATTDRVGG